MSYPQQFRFLVGDSRPHAYLIVLLLILASGLDLLGIGLVWPYVALIVEPESLSERAWLAPLTRALGDGDPHTATVALGYAIVGLFVVKGYIAYRLQRHIIYFGFKHQARLSRRLLEHYRKQGYEFFLTRHSSALIHDVNNNTRSFATHAFIPLLRMCSDTVLALCIVALLAFVNLRGAVILAAMVGIALLAYDRIVRHRVRRYGEEATRTTKRLGKDVAQSIWAAKELRVLGTDQYFADAISRGIDASVRASGQFLSLQVIPRYAMEAILVASVVVLASQTTAGESATAALASLGVFGVAAARLVPSIAQIVGNLGALRFAREATDQLYRAFHDRLPEPHPKRAFEEAADHEAFRDLSMRGVSFAYQQAPRPALRDVDFAIARGEAIGIRGPSGAGKTTLVDVLLGLLIPQSGRIEVNGRSVLDDPERLRRHVAYIPQSPYLIDATVRENVALGVPEPDDERVRTALQRARILDFVQGLPAGLASHVGENAARLSGGQRQRLALARAFYFERDVLILDEVTSALDPGTEEDVIDAIRSLHGETAAVIISHNDNALRHCDVVYTMHDGALHVATHDTATCGQSEAK